MKSFRLAHPAVRATSVVELTASALLTITAAGVWLLVLPLELLHLAAA